MDNIEKVLGILKGQGLDGIYITKEANVKYISGYPDELAYVVICSGELSDYRQSFHRAGGAVLSGF